MTPRERAEEGPSDRAIIAAALWSGENLPALLDAFAAAHVRELLARRNRMTRDEWIGQLQTYLEARMIDAPDETCKALVEKMWQDTADLDDEEE